MISSGRGDQAVVQKTAAETSGAEMSTLDQSCRDERCPHPGRVAGCNDAPQIFEGSNPVVAVLPVIFLVSRARENLLANR